MIDRVGETDKITMCAVPTFQVEFLSFEQKPVGKGKPEFEGVVRFNIH